MAMVMVPLKLVSTAPELALHEWQEEKLVVTIRKIATKSTKVTGFDFRIEEFNIRIQNSLSRVQRCAATAKSGSRT